MRAVGRVVAVGLAALMLVAALALAFHLRRGLEREAFARRGADRAPVRVVDHGPLPTAVRESSGLAVSRAHAGVFWTHNDSGDEPRLYALDASAGLVATIDVGGAEARDWEALDVGPCPGAPGGQAWCLYVADTGDNGRERDHVTVYVVPEPDPSEAAGRVEALGSIRLRYDSGRYDAEALAVTPAGEIVLATKGRAPRMWVFRIEPGAAAAALASGEVITVGPGVALPIEPDFGLGRWLTGGTIDREGTILALRTYTEVYFYAWPMGETPLEAAPTCFLGLIEPNGEAIAFTNDGRLFLSSESPGPLVGHLLEIECAGVGGGTASPE